MSLHKSITQSWAVGTDPDQYKFLKETLGEGHEIIMLPVELLSRIPPEDTATPFVIWMSSQSCAYLDTLPERMVKLIAGAPKVLLLSKEYSVADLEIACDYGFSEILRPPFSRERIADIMRRSIEMYTLHHDMECMAREISLERELLERKNEILNFLVNFLSSSSESLDINHSLTTAFYGLANFLPVTSMNAALWEQNESGSWDVSMYLCTSSGTIESTAWEAVLIEHVRQSLSTDFTIVTQESLQIYEDLPKRHGLPEDGPQLALPLICGTDRMGVIVLSTAMDRHLGRDQAMALDSAMRHFSLTIKNAQRFKQMQMFADYDALTRVHSRRYFDCRLQEEADRHHRYDQPLSLIMLDIDHFKRINDTRGHHVGDIVLREVGGIISSCIRTTDYCARFGGEEFSVLLPHTDSKKTFALAERIRKSIAKHHFMVEGGGPLSVTVSLGISSLSPGDPMSYQELICDADSALYAAKQAGRNKSILSPQILQKQHSIG